MGTPEFAVPSLRILVENGYDVAGVVTATDKRGGRGKKQLLEPAVKKYAVSQRIPVLQPARLKDPAFLEELRRLNANLFVVVAFRMLPEVVWALPEYGTFNLHGSLLPKYRGAAPINWAIMEGEKETGVTTFLIRQEIDTGHLIFQEKMDIGENETAGEVHDRMMELGARVVLKTVKAIEQGNYILKKQDDSQATKAPKIFHETCEINFNQPTQKVHDFIRGLSPYPAAWTTLNGKILKVLKTTKETVAHEHPPGTFLSDDKEWLKIATADGYVLVHELQMEGRRRMNVQDFLNGFSFG
ncbi:MAG: methionyl-tRNA formyltransferase [Lewinellaceae bacterium]|nr:methionyl-tRNA formyltransferase [Lewinellaceae bacterium]